uniref:Uncharacterized protein n=1 Tax=Phlebotomus papatasi TaxID=29031 RepID=A0A1B0D0G1_PHLPP
MSNFFSKGSTEQTVYKRRYTFTTKPSLRTTTPATTTTTTTTSTTTTTTADGVDQEIEQSINQENKFSSSRYNQIGEPIDEEFVLAIKTISKAPPPVPISTPKAASSFKDVTPLKRQFSTSVIMSKVHILRQNGKWGRGLSYDPVGGICNWAAGLGCKE